MSKFYMSDLNMSLRKIVRILYFTMMLTMLTMMTMMLSLLLTRCWLWCWPLCWPWCWPLCWPCWPCWQGERERLWLSIISGNVNLRPNGYLHHAELGSYHCEFQFECTDVLYKTFVYTNNRYYIYMQFNKMFVKQNIAISASDEPHAPTTSEIPRSRLLTYSDVDSQRLVGLQYSILSEMWYF